MKHMIYASETLAKAHEKHLKKYCKTYANI
jgi:hypothetical protein